MNKEEKNVGDCRNGGDLNDIGDNFEDSVSDYELDDAFDLIHREISLNKKDSKNKTAEKEYFCKVCGQSFDKSDLAKCSICSIPCCKKCQSLGYCLNCWVHLNEDTTKTLKLTRILAITISGLILFLNLYGFLYFLLVSLFLVVIFISLHFFIRYKISNRTELYLNKEWYETIKSSQYEQLLDARKSGRFLQQNELKSMERETNERINSLKNWIDQDRDRENYPNVPLLYDQTVDNNNLEKINNFLQDNEHNHKINEFREYSKYPLKKCPKCMNEIKFGNFCAECEIKFCPECNLEHSPYSHRCICGFKFDSLELLLEEFVKKKREK